MSEYGDTEVFWDGVFSQRTPGFDAYEPLHYEWMEDALDWIIEPGFRVIDFGCGSGKLLLRAAAKGAASIKGIDISSNAIEFCEKNAEGCGVPHEFVKGGVYALKDIPDSEFDSGILFNIVDNLLPDDSHAVMKNFKRILKPDGRMIVKLNDYIEPSDMEEMGAEEISNGLYFEQTGLYLWDLTDEEARRLLEEYFYIEEEKRVHYPEHDAYNRLYYLVMK